MDPDTPRYPLKRPSPLHLASSNGQRNVSAGPETARRRSYTTTASLENDREGNHERESNSPGRMGSVTSEKSGKDISGERSPSESTFSVETVKIGSLVIQPENGEPQPSIGDSTPGRLAPTPTQRRKSSGTSTNTVTRSRTLPRGRRSSNNASGTDSHDEECPLTPTKPRRASMKRISSSSFLPPVDNGTRPDPSETRRHSFRKPTSQFVGPDVATRMKRWVEEIVVCNFDLDRGPVVERRMLGRPWAKGEKANIAFSAFPDTSLFAEGHISYSFKIRAPAEDEVPESNGSYFSTPEDSKPSTASTPIKSPSPNRDSGFFGPVTEAAETPLSEKALPTKGETADEYRKWDERGRKWLYGYVWFQQRKDKSIVRGYMQRSIVILSHHAYPSLFEAVLAQMAPIYFSYGYPALEAACHGIAGWPDPVPGATMELPLLTEILRVELPDANEAPQMQKKRPEKQAQEAPLILASLPTGTPLRAFADFLPSLWHIWECLVLGEPLLVIAPDPRTCSHIVWWIRDLIRPIPTSNLDLRPYLHIHDLDFRLIVNGNKPPTGVVVGVTNPFFRNAASHWPNVISVVQPGPNNPSPTTGLAQPPQGFISKRKRHVSKDRVLLKRLEQLVAAGQLDDEAGNDALRHHFHQLTEKMLAPLNRFVSSLIPPNTSTPVIPFSLSAFLQHLKALAPNPLQFRSKGLLSKGKVETEFYTTFCTAGCFMTWYQNHMSSVQARRGSIGNGTWPSVEWSSAHTAPHARVSESADSSLESRSSGTMDSQESTPRSSVGSMYRSPDLNGQAAVRKNSAGTFWTLEPKRRS